MNVIKVPVVPVEKEDQVVKQFLKSSDDQPVESNKFSFYESDFDEDLELVLHGIGMEKYIDVFLKSDITLQMFLQFDESDLKELGITDENDLKTMMENIKLYESTKEICPVPDNSLHDLQIAKNVSNELILLQNYCSYLELQMRKHKLSDYRINWNESALTYLKAFIDASLLQAKILNQKVFNDSEDNHLLGKALKLENITMSEYLGEKLKKKKFERKNIVVSAIVIFGVLSVVIFCSVRTFLNKQ